MKMKHTPGPWTVKHTENRGWYVFVGPERAADEVLHIGFFGGRLEHRNLDEANARLIASAPELLAAMIKVEEALKKDSRGKTISGDTVEYHLDGQEMSCAINFVRAAIAKATA